MSTNQENRHFNLKELHNAGGQAVKLNEDHILGFGEAAPVTTPPIDGRPSDNVGVRINNPNYTGIPLSATVPGRAFSGAEVLQLRFGCQLNTSISTSPLWRGTAGVRGAYLQSANNLVVGNLIFPITQGGSIVGRRLECAVDVVRTDTSSGAPGDTSEVSATVNGENLGTQTLGGDRDDSFDITRLLADEGFFGSSGCTLFHIQLRRPGYVFRMFIDEGSGTSLSSEAGDTNNVSATIPGALFTDWAWVS